MRFDLGMVTCPRRDATTDWAIAQLRAGGFTDPLTVFAEPTTVITTADTLIEHGVQMGGPRNWFFGLNYLLQHGDAEHILLVEDDATYCRGAAARLIQGIERFPDYALMNLYLPVRDAPHVHASGYGWIKRQWGNKTFGTLACCFRRHGPLQQFVKEPAVRAAVQRPSCSYDVLLYEFLLHYGYAAACYGHRPSLTDHVGVASLLRHADHFTRRGLDFQLDYY